MSLLTQLLESHGGAFSEALAGKLGVSKEQAAGVLPQIAPLILGATRRRADEGDEDVEALLEKHGDEQAVEDAPAFFQGDAKGADAEGLLGPELMDRAADLISAKLGVSKEIARSALPMIVSFVLGALNRKKKDAGDGAAGLDMVRGFLDQDGDGSVMDDIGDLLGGGGKGSGGLGGLMGGFMGGKK